MRTYREAVEAHQAKPNPETKCSNDHFMEGDRVRVVSKFSTFYNYEGTVVKVNASDGHYAYSVALDYPKDARTLSFSRFELRKVVKR